MSSTNRGGERLADDFYSTPAWVTAGILPKLNWSKAEFVADPCAGDGAILRAVRAHGHTGGLMGIELDKDRAGLADCVCSDALKEHWSRPDLVIMNPPFTRAIEFVEKALAEIGRGGEVAALMRLAMLAGQERSAFWAAHPADVYVLSRRPNFTESLRWVRGMSGGPCGKAVEHTRSGSCRRPAGHEGACMTCSGDSADYAWFVWGPGRGHRWERIEA